MDSISLDQGQLLASLNREIITFQEIGFLVTFEDMLVEVMIVQSKDECAG